VYVKDAEIIPMVDIFVTDSLGGYIVSLGQITDIEFFSSLTEAKEKYEFIDSHAIEQQLNDVSRETMLS
jgi:hypothetical protein